MQATDLVKQAINKVGLAEQAAVPTVLFNWAWAALQRIYEDVWNSYPWRDTKLMQYVVSVDANSDDIVLPSEVDAITGMASTTETLFPLNEFLLVKNLPGWATESGAKAYQYFAMPDSPVLVQPAAAYAVEIVSSSTADTSGSVVVVGVSGGVDTAVTLTINGTSAAGSGTVTFTEIKSVSKPATTGTITLRKASAGTTYAVLLPWQTQGSYRRIRLYPIPTVAITFYVEALRRFQPLVSQYDAILLRHAESAIFDMLCAELYEYDDRHDLAQAEYSKASSRLQRAQEREDRQNDTDQRVSFPAAGDFGSGRDFDYGDDPNHKTW